MSYFQIGIYQSKTPENIGTLWRSAYQLGASGIFTIGKRYKGITGIEFSVPYPCVIPTDYIESQFLPPT